MDIESPEWWVCVVVSACLILGGFYLLYRGLVLLGVLGLKYESARKQAAWTHFLSGWKRLPVVGTFEPEWYVIGRGKRSLLTVNMQWVSTDYSMPAIRKLFEDEWRQSGRKVFDQAQDLAFRAFFKGWCSTRSSSPMTEEDLRGQGAYAVAGRDWARKARAKGDTFIPVSLDPDNVRSFFNQLWAKEPGFKDLK